MTLAEYQEVSEMMEEVKVLKEDLHRIQKLEHRMQKRDEPVTLDIQTSSSCTLVAFDLKLKEGETRFSKIWSYKVGQSILSRIKSELTGQVESLEQEIASFTGTKVDHLESNKDKEGQTDGCN